MTRNVSLISGEVHADGQTAADWQARGAVAAIELIAHVGLDDLRGSAA